MTIGGWLICIIFSVLAGIGVYFWKERIGPTQVVCWLLIVAIIFGIGFWYFHNTASGARRLADQRSNFQNGLERVITVYTADGTVLAQYEGKIDLEQNDGGYVKFDLNGKRYIYYNCFVESIANLN